MKSYRNKAYRNRNHTAVFLLLFLLSVSNMTGCKASGTENKNQNTAEASDEGSGMQNTEEASGTADGRQDTAAESETESKKQKEKNGGKREAWCVYWDGEIGASLKNQDFDSVSLFGCYYDEKDQFYIPEELEELRDTVEESYSGRRYLSFVNDIQKPDGSSVQKDAALVKRLLGKEEAARNHVRELVALAENLGCSGIEVDYEKIKDMDLWKSYLRFIRILEEKTSEEQMGLRIVLQSSAPVEKLEFPQGAEYVVMCYNLYGYHSGPGPKADREFLTDIVNSFSGLPSISYALANGGFDWDAKGKVRRSVTTAEAEKMAEQHGSRISRDAESAACWFTYQASDGTHTVWYADETTLASWETWISEAQGHPADISLWRIE